MFSIHPQSVKAVAPPKTHLEWQTAKKIPALSGDLISLLCYLTLTTWFPHLATLYLSQPQLASPQSRLSYRWPVPDVPAASNALARVVRNTVCLPHRKDLLNFDLVLTTALTASIVWEVSRFRNLNQRHNDPLSEAPSNPSSVVSRIYPHLPRIVPRSSIRPTSPFSLQVYFLSISVGRVTSDSRRKLVLHGAWWKSLSSNAAQAHVGALMGDAHAGILVLDVVSKEILLPAMPLVLAR
jgi:hypothetical protein